MTKKDYINIASIIKSEVNHWENMQPQVNNALVSISKQLAKYFASDNPRFDKNKFYTACEVIGLQGTEDPRITDL